MGIKGRQHSAKVKGYIIEGGKKETKRQRITLLSSFFGDLPLRRFNTVIVENLPWPWGQTCELHEAFNLANIIALRGWTMP